MQGLVLFPAVPGDRRRLLNSSTEPSSPALFWWSRQRWCGVFLQCQQWAAGLHACSVCFLHLAGIQPSNTVIEWIFSQSKSCTAGRRIRRSRSSSVIRVGGKPGLHMTLSQRKKKCPTLRYTSKKPLMWSTPEATCTLSAEVLVSSCWP